MAKKIQSQERTKIEGGKPEFPFIDLSGKEINIPDMSDFVSNDT